MSEYRAERFLDWSDEKYFAHEYPADRPCLSQSMAAILRGCPAEAAARHPLIWNDPHHTLEKRSTKATTIGVGVEQFLLSGGVGVEHVPFDDFRKKAAKESRDEAIAAGRLPLTNKLHDQVLKVATVASAQLVASGVHFTGDSQVVYIWPRETTHGTIWCRGRLDHVKVSPGKVVIYDLKTTRNASHDKFARSVIDYGYHIQGAAYEEAVRAYHGNGQPLEVEYYLILVEPGSAAINVSVRSFSPEMSSIGAHEWHMSCELWAKCLSEDKWPGYIDTEQNGPGWYLGRYEDVLR